MTQGTDSPGQGGDDQSSSNGNGSGNENGNGRRGGGRGPNVRRTNYALVGTIVVSVLAMGLVLGITRPEWQQYLDWGFTTRQVALPGDYYTLPNSSKVKIGGVEVGRIDSYERQEDGTALATVRVQSDVPDIVGSAPSANLRTATLLGGIVYIDLLPGGDRTQSWQDPIPKERTTLPVELSPVVQAIQPDALKGLPATVNGLQGSLQNGGVQAIQRLGREAPGALGPGAGVINALQGQNPGTDLPAVVNGLQKTTATLARRDGQIEAIVTDLRRTTSAFAQSSRPTQEAIRTLPAALDTARPGLARLSITLDKLKETAGPARPTVQELDKLLQRLDPFLVKARPVVNNLRYALQETRPLVDELRPAVKDLRQVFDGLNPTLDRVNGPIIGQLETGFLGGDTPGANGSSDGRRHFGIDNQDAKAPKLRQELGPMLARLAATDGYYDSRAHGVSFSANASTESFGGSIGGIDPPTLFQIFAGLIPTTTSAASPVAGLPAVPQLPLRAPQLPVRAPQLPAAVPGAPIQNPAAVGGLLNGGPR